MEVYLIRHTAVDVEPGLCYGQTDVPLKEGFMADFKVIRDKLPSNINKVYSSTSTRCLKLAKFLNEKVESRDDLREMDFGDWENRLWKEIPGEESEAWMENFVEAKTPNGESMWDLFMRVSLFVDELRNKNYDKVVVVSHAGVIRCILGYILEVPLENLFKIQVEFGQIIKLELDIDRDLDCIRL